MVGTMLSSEDMPIKSPQQSLITRSFQHLPDEDSLGPFRRLSRATTTLLLCFYISACANSLNPIPAVDQIVFITIDTLRADHLPEFGYPINTAPFLTGLSLKGISFKNTFAHSATTGPSHASMFTSLYPIQHGVQNNGQKLDESFVTLAELLSQRDFVTAAFVSGNAHFGSSQIAQGFAHYNQPSDQEMRDERDRLTRYRPADRTTNMVIEWYEQQTAQAPLFLWVHYYDPHNPLNPPAIHIGDVEPSNDSEMKKLTRFLVEEHRSDLTRRNSVKRIISYDAEIRFVDTQIERLYESIETKNSSLNTLWVVTSDHGQGLSNHNWFGHHRHIYNEQLHVPLFFYFSSGEVKSRIVEDLVEHVDVPVTILELLGTGLYDGMNMPQGRSLVPLMAGNTTHEHKQLAFSERRRLLTPRTNAPPHRRAAYEPGERYSLQSRDAKYLWFSEGPDEFYDLISDPYETENLIDKPSIVKSELKETLQTLVNMLRTDRQGEMVDDETLQRLRSLGYLR